jgi:hypothetical protein
VYLLVVSVLVEVRSCWRREDEDRVWRQAGGYECSVYNVVHDRFIVPDSFTPLATAEQKIRCEGPKHPGFRFGRVHFVVNFKLSFVSSDGMTGSKPPYIASETTFYIHHQH